YGINPQRTQRYISHANQFIVLANGKRLADHNAADIETYLSDKGRDPDTSDSCFREIALVLKILFIEVVAADWALTYAWGDMKLQARPLEALHPSIARGTLMSRLSRCYYLKTSALTMVISLRKMKSISGRLLA
ncbi:hypothetical protein MNBD_GAMMA09-1237, partial [hydrothermal vent metagenome]